MTLKLIGLTIVTESWIGSDLFFLGFGVMEFDQFFLMFWGGLMNDFDGLTLGDLTKVPMRENLAL